MDYDQGLLFRIKNFVKVLWLDLVEMNCYQLYMITNCGNYNYVLLIIRHAFSLHILYTSNV